jgi:VIT1/CCC1 family predicted Fe2+/Mn2+ transporter
MSKAESGFLNSESEHPIESVKALEKDPLKLPKIMQEHQASQDNIVNTAAQGAIQSIIDSVDKLSNWIGEQLTKNRLDSLQKAQIACTTSKKNLETLKSRATKLRDPEAAKAFQTELTAALAPVNEALKNIRDGAKPALAAAVTLQKISFSRLPAAFSMTLGMSKIKSAANHVKFSVWMSNQLDQNVNLHKKIQAIETKKVKNPKEQEFVDSVNGLKAAFISAGLTATDIDIQFRKMLDTEDPGNFMKYAEKFSKQMEKFKIPEIKNPPEKLKAPVELLNKVIRACNKWVIFVQEASRKLFAKVAVSEFQTTPMKIASGLALGCLSILAPLAMVLPLALPAAGVAATASVAVAGIAAAVSATLTAGLAAVGVAASTLMVFGGVISSVMLMNQYKAAHPESKIESKHGGSQQV